MSGEESFSVSCPGCAANLRVPLRFAGKNAACPKCKASIALVPSTAATPVPRAPGPSSNQSQPPTPQRFFIRDPFTEEVHGPYEASALKTMAAKGTIDASWKIAKSATGPWFSASEIKGLDLTANANAKSVKPSDRSSGTAGTSPDNMRRLVAKHAALLKQNASFSCYPDIPLKKQKAAAEYGSFLPDEQLLFIYDATIMGSAKHGFAWTTHAIHYVDPNKNRLSVPFTQITSIFFANHGALSSVLRINNAVDVKFNNNVSHIEPFLTDFKMQCLGGGGAAQLNEAEQVYYLNIDANASDWIEDEKLRMARSLASWDQQQGVISNQLPQILTTQERPLTLGAPFPQIEDIILANLDHDESVKVMMAGVGVQTLCFTNKSIIIVAETIDTDASDSGESGELKGAVAGHLAGAGLGQLLGSQFGFTGMLVGQMLGSAGGLLAGAEAGKAWSRNIITNVMPIILPYSSIKKITSGHKNLGKAGSYPMFTFISADYPTPVEFLFDKEVQMCATPLLNAMRKAVAENATPPQSAAPSRPPSGGEQDAFARLKALKGMLEAGLITEDEFNQKKQKLLDLL